MKIYIDFDGVIFDTESLLFLEYNELKKKEVYIDKIKYIQEKDWEKLLSESHVINDAINIIKSLDINYSILTKVHSMDNEGVAKIKILRKLGIKNDIILSPYTLKKTDVVDSKDNILVDDTVHNLDDWHSSGGIPIFFNKDYKDIDSWNNTNKKYLKIKSLNYLNNINMR